MKFSWVAAAVFITYIHVFNKVATIYLDSGRTLQWSDLYRKVVPGVEITLKI